MLPIHRERYFPCRVSLYFKFQAWGWPMAMSRSSSRGKFDCSIYGVDVAGEWFDEVCAKGHEGLIDVPPPYGDLMKESVKRRLFKQFHETIGHTMTHRGSHGSAFCLCVNDTLDLEIGCGQTCSEKAPYAVRRQAGTRV